MQMRDLLIGSGIGLAALSWGITAELRIQRLSEKIEEQQEKIGLIAVAPAVQRQGEPSPIENPLHKACADLAIRSSDASAAIKISVVSDIERLMANLGCNDVLRKQTD